MNRKERRTYVSRSSDSYDTLFDRGVAFMTASRWLEAETALRTALVRKRTSAALHNLGSVLVALGRLDEAIQTFRQALRLAPDSQRTHNSLVKPMYELGRLNEAIHHGTRALELKDQEAAIEFPRYEPFLRVKPALTPTKDLISFCLWGGDRLYTTGALQNVALSDRLYPGWICRYYLDDTVPIEIRNALTDRGAEIVAMPRPPEGRRYDALFWRFLAADDPAVRRVLFRDCDSLLNERERDAVDAWTSSNRTAHLMRDHALHCELILAGMWGALAPGLPLLGEAIQHWQAANQHPLNARVQDQIFLRHVVWPIVRADHLAHDSTYRVVGSEPFPTADGPCLGVRDAVASAEIGCPELPAGSLVLR